MICEEFRLTAHFVVPNRFREGRRTRSTRLERTTAPERIWLIRNAAAIDRLSVHSIALVIVHLRNRRIDRDLVKVRTSQTRDLGVNVRMDSASQQRIV